MTTLTTMNPNCIRHLHEVYFRRQHNVSFFDDDHRMTIVDDFYEHPANKIDAFVVVVVHHRNDDLTVVHNYHRFRRNDVQYVGDVAHVFGLLNFSYLFDDLATENDSKLAKNMMMKMNDVDVVVIVVDYIVLRACRVR